MKSEKRTLGDCVDILSGFAFKSGEFNVTDHGLPLIRIRDVVTGSSGTYFSGDYSDTYLIEDGDLLVGMDGDFNREIWFGGLALLNQRVCKITAHPGILDQRYLYHFLPQELDKIHARTSAVTVKHLSVKGIRAIEVDLPHLEEQKRIAAILDKADNLRRKRQQAIQLADEFLRAVFLDMFGDPVTNVKGWKSSKLGNLCTIVRGSSPRPKGDARYYGGNIPRLMVADLTRDGKYVTPRIDSLTEEGAKKSRPIESGTVVMAVSGNVGLTSILEVNACIHDGFIAFKNLNDSIQAEFLVDLMMFLKSTHSKRQAGAIFQNLTTTQIKEMEIPLPPESIQRTYLSMVEAIAKIQKRQKNSCDRLDETFGSISQKAFSGKL